MSELFTLEELQEIRSRADSQFGTIGWSIGDALVQRYLNIPRESSLNTAKRILCLAEKLETTDERDARELREWKGE